MDEANEDHTLAMAEMTRSALAMNRAFLDCDLLEARFCARLIQQQAASAGDPPLKEAAALVVRLLGPAGATPSLACGAAMLALSTHLGDRLIEDCSIGSGSSTSAGAPLHVIRRKQGQVFGAGFPAQPA
jgi:hypothetical protein